MHYKYSKMLHTDLYRVIICLNNELLHLVACHVAKKTPIGSVGAISSASFARDLTIVSLGYEKGWNVNELQETIAVLVALSKGKKLNPAGMVAYERAITYMNDIATDSRNSVAGLRHVSEKLV